MKPKSSGNKRKDTYHHGHLKEELVAVAERLLERDGVAGLSLRNVAREAKVSHAAPYRHFRDKTVLLSELMRIGFERLARAMRESAQKHPDDPAAQLLAAGRSYVRLAVQSPALTTLMFGGLPRDEIPPEYQTAGLCAFEGLTAIIETGRKAGIYGKGDTMTLAVTAWSMVHGLATLISSRSLEGVSKNERRPDALAAAVCEILLQGMLK